jgi:hypothetical protein
MLLLQPKCNVIPQLNEKTGKYEIHPSRHGTGCPFCTAWEEVPSKDGVIPVEYPTQEYVPVAEITIRWPLGWAVYCPGCGNLSPWEPQTVKVETMCVFCGDISIIKPIKTK